MNNWDEIVKMIEVGIDVAVCVVIVLFFVALGIAWYWDSRKVVYPWEKAERLETKRKAKAEAKAQKEFWKNRI